jgi:TatD DNase family protein
MDRLLIETDSPYLAPVPFRGKTNNPFLRSLCGQTAGQTAWHQPEEIGELTSQKLNRLCFQKLLSDAEITSTESNKLL